MLPAKFLFIWLNDFRGEYFFLEIVQSETRMSYICRHGSGPNEQSLKMIFHRCFLPSVISFDQAVSEEKLFYKSINQKQELPMAAMFVYGSERNYQS